MTLYLIDNATITPDTVTIKFGRTVKISSLIASNFKVFTDAATPVEVVNPFSTVEPLTDYNQVSRILTLRWKVILPANTGYTIGAIGLLDSSGLTIPTETLRFTTESSGATPDSFFDSSVPVVNEILVKDSSIRVGDIGATYSIIGESEFYVVKSDPENGDFYLPPDYNNGRLTISFSQRPANSFININYFRCQRKKIQKAPSRWESVTVNVSLDASKPDVYLDFPALQNAIPTEEESATFGDPQLPLANCYFERGYKYRVIISSEVSNGLLESSLILGQSVDLSFATEITPVYIDPELILSFFPEATLLEIGEIIHYYSLEVKSLFKLLVGASSSDLSFNVLEYIKSATLCELSRTYEHGTGDDVSIRLGDFEVVNKTIPRGSMTRDNAVTWCQIAAVMRKEVLTSSARSKVVQPKNLPSAYVPTRSPMPMDRDVYGQGQEFLTGDDPMPSRRLKKYD